MDNMDNTESPDFELPNSETLSNLSGFSPSDICDMDKTLVGFPLLTSVIWTILTISVIILMLILIQVFG